MWGEPGASMGHTRPGALRYDAAYFGETDITAKINLRLACNGLQKKDLLSHSDPFCVLYEWIGEAQGRWEEAGRTEVVSNNPNPRFVQHLSVLFKFEQEQRMKVVVYDADERARSVMDLKLAKQDYLGEVDFVLSEVITAEHKFQRMKLTNKGKSAHGWGSIEITAEEAVDYNKNLIVTIRGHKLANRDSSFGGKSDPFVVFNRANGSQNIPVFQTKVITDEPNPRWPAVVVPLAHVCRGDPNMQLNLQVKDWNSSGKHVPIGSTALSVNEILDFSKTGSLCELTGRRTMWGAKPGHISFADGRLQDNPSFVGFIQAGLQIGFTVAIDFTASNGNPSDKGSLHYHRGGPTPYEQAIRSMGKILDKYNRESQYAVYGFGCHVHNQTQHCHPLNDQPQSPFIQGIDGIVGAYYNTLRTCALSGPTNFSPVIRAAHQVAARHQRNYYCLLIITDGAITDMQETKRAIVDASSAPLSIIIVGVGDASFSSMDKLDSDRQLLCDDKGRKAARDIVQFVPFNKHAHDPDALTRCTLAELPGQVTEYYSSINVTPEILRQAASQPLRPSPSTSGVLYPAVAPSQFMV